MSRTFVSIAFALAALLVPAASRHLRAQDLIRYPVTGAVTDRSATVMAWLSDAGTVRVAYGTDSTALNAPSSLHLAATADNDFVVKATLTDLAAATRYYYRIETEGGQPLSPLGSFITFPAAGVDAPVTILFGSCQQSRANDSGPVFNLVPTLGGDVFVHLGDWTYPDYLVPGFPDDPASLRTSYLNRLDTAYSFTRRVLSRMGLVYAWDDHDFHSNNSHGSLPGALKRRLLEAYNRYMPHYPLPNSGEGIWHSFTIGNVEVFVIDSRSQRSVPDSAFKGNSFAPPPGHSMLAGYPVTGTDQRTWLMDAIRRSKARWKLLASPVFFNPGSGDGIPLALLLSRRDVALEFADKWIGFPEDIDSMKTLFAQGHDRNMLVISGDAHTNLYDDGTHSLVPEFMVGNLDKTNSNLFEQMRQAGFNVWTAGQEGTSSSIGRIRVETTPRHRLIVESFDTAGRRLLSYELEDRSGSSGVEAQGGTLRVTSVTASGDRLQIRLSASPAGDGSIEVFGVDGRLVMERRVVASGAEVNVSIRTLPPATYLGRLRFGEQTFPLRFTIAR